MSTQDLVEAFREKAREQEGAALALRNDSQFELAAVANVRAQVYRHCAEMAEEEVDY